MVSMAAAGRSPADHFALCHRATQGEDFPVPTEMNVFVDNNVRVSSRAPAVRAGAAGAAVLGRWLDSSMPEQRQAVPKAHVSTGSPRSNQKKKTTSNAAAPRRSPSAP